MTKPNENPNAGSGDGTGKAAATETPPDVLAKFGLQPTGTPPGDPAKKTNDGSKPPDAGDPDKGTTPGDGSAKGAEGQGEPQKKYAGKYDTPQALAAGYSNLMNHSVTLQTENKTLREKMAEIEAKIKEMEKGKPAGQPASGPDPKILKAFRDNPAMKAARDALLPVLGEDAYQAFEDGLMAATSVNQASNRETALKLQQLEQERFEAQFFKQRPDAEDPDIREALATLLKEAGEHEDDQFYQMGLIVDAVKGRMLDTLIEKGVLSRVKALSEEDRRKLIAGNLVAGTTGAAGESDGTGPNTKRERQRRTFFGDKPDRMK